MFDTYSPTQTCKDSYVMFEVITPEDFKKLYVQEESKWMINVVVLASTINTKI